jgi:hypothetical protein
MTEINEYFECLPTGAKIAFKTIYTVSDTGNDFIIESACNVRIPQTKTFTHKQFCESDGPT